METAYLAAFILGVLMDSVLCLLGAPSPGYVVAWGRNLTPSDPAFPPSDYYSTGVVSIAGVELSNAVRVAAGGAHAMALKSDGTVAGWGPNWSLVELGYETPSVFGTNGYVKLGGRELNNVVAIAASRTISMDSFGLALKRDGSVLGWGGNIFGQATIPDGLRDVTAIAAGAYHGLALKSDGTIASWGKTRRPPDGVRNVVAIAAGGEGGRNLALMRDGTVTDWAVLSVESASAVPVGLSNVVAVSAGTGHYLALRSDGTVVGWGSNRYGGATGVSTPEFPHESSGAVMVAGQVLSNVVAIAAGDGYSLAVKKDGTVVAWGAHQNRPVTVPAGLTGVVAVSAGYDFCVAITTNTSGLVPCITHNFG